MLFHLIRMYRENGNLGFLIVQSLFSIFIVLFSLTIHECAHGYVASKLGDNTAKNMGRLSLNPLRHLDPFGFLCMLLVGFGWANPVPINARNFKNPRRDMALSAAAGPLSNLIIAFVCVLFIRIIFFFWKGVNLFLETLFMFFYMALYMNITLAVFNMIPIPPLDGSRLLYVFLPPKAYFGIMRYERYIVLAVMLLLVTGVLDPAINFVATGILRLMLRIVGLGRYIGILF